MKQSLRVVLPLIVAVCGCATTPAKQADITAVAVESAALTPQIRAADAHTHVEFLASDRLEGRMTASPGARMAGDYIAEQFRAFGLEPAGDEGTYFQQFPFKDQSCRNVIGLLPPVSGSTEYLLLGAHYDHIGHGEGGGSLADKSDAGQIHNGADDNASGVSLVLELAATFAAERKSSSQTTPQRGLIFACWSGEEEGILGSSYFASNSSRPLEQIVGYVNFDMVGRLRDNKLVVQGGGSSTDWRRYLEKRNVSAGFNLVLQDDPYQPTDMTAFYPRGLPVLGFFTGAHGDYNKPSDDAQTLNYEGIERITLFAKSLVESIAADTARLAYAKVEMKPPSERGPRRVSTGTIPDYAGSNVEGMPISGVRAGGPADLAGLKAGDIIIEIAGQKIANVQDYQTALEKIEPDVTVDVIILRQGERLSLKITPVGL